MTASELMPSISRGLMNTARRRDPTEGISLLIEQHHITFEQAEKFAAACSPQLSVAGTGTIPIVILDVVKLLTWAPKDALWVAVRVPDSLVLTQFPGSCCRLRKVRARDALQKSA